jgi:hypothetical protein
MARDISMFWRAAGTSSRLRQMLAATPPLNDSLLSHGIGVDLVERSKRYR